MERSSRGRERELAAIIIEPVQGAGGIRAADPAFLRFLRDFTTRIGALLIFDEIICVPRRARRRAGSSRREAGPHDARQDHRWRLSLAAFGGRADVMDVFDARRPGALSHGGTFNGNPVAAAAGLATLRELTPERYARLERSATASGSRLQAGIAADRARRAGRRHRIAVPGRPDDEPTAATATGPASRALWLGLLLEGFSLAPRGMGAIPVVATEADIDDFAAAATRTIESLSPVPA